MKMERTIEPKLSKCFEVVSGQKIKSRWFLKRREPKNWIPEPTQETRTT